MTQKGFTLIEVLASVAILGLGIIAVMKLFSGSLGLAKASSDSTSKVLFAREKMKSVLLEEKNEEGIFSGNSEGFDWVLNISEFEGSSSQKVPKIMKIELNVKGASGAPFKITTLKIIPGI